MLKGIDVSAYNGTIDWGTVAAYGMDFAILRITEKGNVVDSSFERNYKGCIDNHIPVGVYKYSYALNVSEIQEEARGTGNESGQVPLCAMPHQGIAEDAFEVYRLLFRALVPHR